MSALDVALYLYEFRSAKDDLDLFAAAKPYLAKDTEYFTNGDGNIERFITRCVFQNASCADSLETFIQLKCRENFHPTYWSRSIAKQGRIQPKAPMSIILMYSSCDKVIFSQIDSYYLFKIIFVNVNF